MTPPKSGKPDISVVVPLLNEEDNVIPLISELREVMNASSYSWEVIFVDDGSSDDTACRLIDGTACDPRFVIIRFTRKFGQTAALSAGFDAARADIIVPMDGDRQNDPRDIPRLVAKLEQGNWDIVSGWRKSRKDKFLSRRFPSAAANLLVRRLTWTPEIHDFGCSLKAYRRDVLSDVKLYGEMHRFLPAICKWRGARVTEEIVNHRARTAGSSKYGLKRTIKVLLDLVTVKFLGDYLTKPIYFFGKLALVALTVSFLAIGLTIVQKFGYLTEHGSPVNMNNNVFLLLAVMLFLMAVMFVLVGVLSELLVRIYHENQKLTPYKIKTVIKNTGESDSEDKPRRSYAQAPSES